jgi:hypothetical protein
LWRQRLTALQAWYDAEYARAHRSTEEPGFVDFDTRRVRRGPAAVVGDVRLPAGRRGPAAPRPDGSDGGDPAARAGYDLAVRLAADGTRADLEELGRLAHVDLRPSEATVWADELHLPALTPRGTRSPRLPGPRPHLRRDRRDAGDQRVDSVL